MNMRIKLPAVIVIYEKQRKNIIQQMIQPEIQLEVSIEDYKRHRVKGHILRPINGRKEQILLIYKQTKSVDGFNKVLWIKQDDLIDNSSDFIDLSEGKWIKHPKFPKRSVNYKNRVKKVLDSWLGTFSYKYEDIEKNRKGLRPPQIGAIHAAHKHWSISNEAATVVMPTGTGKTETMLSILVSKQCERLLVVVPTDTLRTQIADKFLTLGILKEIDFEILSTKGLYPIVGLLNHIPKNCEDVDVFFKKCNVIVTTMQIAGQCGVDIQERMAYHCPYLFIDEAHHSPAKTWNKLKQKFEKKKILQFTATPFRNDGKEIDGEIIFNYPLNKAQKEGYFKTIHFKPIREYYYSKVDQVIAENAIMQLENDLMNGHDHIIMARVGNINKAEKIFSIYAQYTRYNPVLIHSRMSSKDRNEILEKIKNRESRIVVCVDMFGEGFDLPEMKIAALHDIRKSLAVTLQLAGRFTRTGKNLGDATFFADITDVNVKDKLEKLYYHNSDWNVLLRDASEEIIKEKIDLQELLNGFQDSLTNITLKNIRPAMSTVIYKTTCGNWEPEKYKKGLLRSESFDRIEHDINNQKHTLVFITGKKIPVDWAQSKDIFNWDWELYILFWDKEQNLLFIHSSNKTSYYSKLAEAIVGEAELIRDDQVFRCLWDIKRLIFHNVGLRQQVSQSVGYTMTAGSDVERGLSEAQKQQAMKSNFFGAGYEGGSKVTIGCTYKGRIWSHRKTDIEGLRKWCSNVGSKLLDEKIDTDEILKGTIIPKHLPQRPKKMPINIEWPEEIYKEHETNFTFVFDDHSFPIFQTDIELLEPTLNGDLIFEICSDEVRIKCQLKLAKNEYEFLFHENMNVTIMQNTKSMSLQEFFYNNPPRVWFADGSSLVGNKYFELKKDISPYSKQKIRTLNWDDVDIKKESQGKSKEQNSIQYRVIKELEKSNYDVIFDDDGRGEAADIVCVRDCKKSIQVEFYHCKYSREKTPGGRIDDLYTVCGQAQKSINWGIKPTELFDHLLRRESLLEGQEQISRFEKGNIEELWKIKEMSKEIPVELSIFIVQPGLSKSKATIDQLRLLSVTESYLMDTYQLSFGVIASN